MPTMPLSDLSIRSSYYLGLFEATQLCTSVLGVLVAVAGAGMASVFGADACLHVAVICLGACGLSLLAAIGSLADSAISISHIRPTRIQLARGWVEIGPRQIRRLVDAEVKLEQARMLFFPVTFRVCLAFPDGTTVPIAQGSGRAMGRLHRRITDAPALRRHKRAA